MSGLGPLTGPDGTLLDQVRLVGLVARGHHGVLSRERRFGQDFEVDVTLHLDTAPAARSDDLADTVDYGVLAGAVAKVIRGHAVNLVETLAQRVADVCLADPRVVAADVAVHKPHAPVQERFSDVVVVVRRLRRQAGPGLRSGPEHRSTEGDVQ